MFRIIPLLFIVAIAFTTPAAQAQINSDIPETEGPGDGGGGNEGQEFYCAQCCKRWNQRFRVLRCLRPSVPRASELRRLQRNERGKGPLQHPSGA